MRTTTKLTEASNRENDTMPFNREDQRKLDRIADFLLALRNMPLDDGEIHCADVRALIGPVAILAEDLRDDIYDRMGKGSCRA